MINGPRDAVKRARRLRSEMSLPQVMLWRELRKRPGGFKFRREHPAGRDYTLDFYCASLRLDIEVDGFAHDSAPAATRDGYRSHYLRSQGVATLRVPAKAILDDIEAVVVRIVQVCEERREKLAMRKNPPLSGNDEGARAESAASRGHSMATAPLHQPSAGPPPRAGED